MVEVRSNASASRRRHHCGSTLLLVLLLTGIAAVAIMTFFSTVRQERSRTAKLIQRTRAQNMARRVVSRIAALVQQKPWSNRFFLDQPFPFYSSEGLLKEDGGDFRDGNVNYEGVIQKLSALEKRFRVKLRLTYPSLSMASHDYKYSSSWDLQYSEGILGSLNRMHVLGSAESDDPDTPQDDLDRQLDLIRDVARRPAKEPQIAGGEGEPLVEDIRMAEQVAEGVKAGELAKNPTDLLGIPGIVDGTVPEGETARLAEARSAIERLSASSPGATLTTSVASTDSIEVFGDVNDPRLATLPDGTVIRVTSFATEVRAGPGDLTKAVIGIDVLQLRPRCPCGCSGGCGGLVNSTGYNSALDKQGRSVMTCRPPGSYSGPTKCCCPLYPR